MLQEFLGTLVFFSPPLASLADTVQLIVTQSSRKSTAVKEPEGLCRVHRSQPLASLLLQFNTALTYFSKIYFLRYPVINAYVFHMAFSL
jgi:hypothetical protein